MSLAGLEEDASAHAQAVASEKTQNALDRAEEEAFSNSESEADSACSSILVAWSDSDGDASASSSELEPEEDDDTVKAGLNSVSLTTIRRFANRSRRWIDAYRWSQQTAGICCGTRRIGSSRDG